MSRVEGGNILSSQEADVGILRQKKEDDDDDTLQPDENVKKTTSSSRLDVYNALQNAKFVGSSHYAGKGGGLATTPGLFIHDIGRISLPITNEQSKALKANSWKTNDDGMLLINKILYLLYTNVLD